MWTYDTVQYGGYGTLTWSSVYTSMPFPNSTGGVVATTPRATSLDAITISGLEYSGRRVQSQTAGVKSLRTVDLIFGRLLAIGIDSEYYFHATDANGSLDYVLQQSMHIDSWVRRIMELFYDYHYEDVE